MDRKMSFLDIKFLSLQSKLWVSSIILGIIFSISFVKTINAESGVTGQLLEEAKVLLEREAQFFDARLKNDWKKLHSLQHPDFRKKVSVEEVRFFEGWVAYDYREKALRNAHISGAAVPTLDFIKKHPNKLDPLGFPVTRRYQWSGDPYIKIQTYSLEKITISKDGKYAKVKIMVKGRQRLNPAMIRGDVAFAAQFHMTDYWEKVDGNWVITLLKAPVSMSGAGVLKFFLPNDSSAWKKMEFVDIGPEDLNLS